MSETSQDKASLSVERKGLLAAFKLIKKLARPRAGEQAVLSFDGDRLRIDLSGMVVHASAHGYWGGQARVDGDWLRRIAMIPPSGDPVVFRVCEGSLHCQSLTCSCEWQLDTPLLSRSVFATDAEILVMKHECAPEEIDASGLRSLVDAADAGCSQRCQKAADILKRYGVQTKHLRALVDQVLNQGVDL